MPMQYALPSLWTNVDGLMMDPVSILPWFDDYNFGIHLVVCKTESSLYF